MDAASASFTTLKNFLFSSMKEHLLMHLGTEENCQRKGDTIEFSKGPFSST
jgi:hypothetical protein